MPKNLTTTTLPPPSEDYMLEDYEYEDDVYKKVYNISTRITLILQILTVIVNLLHLIVLFRKDLRTIAIFILMIGIAISDIITSITEFLGSAAEIEWIPILFPGSGEMSCLRDDYLEVNIGQQAIATFRDISRRLSVWLSILMAAIRSLTVLFPMSQRIQNMTKPKGAVITLLLCVLFWTVFNTWQFVFYRVFWLPDNANKLCLSMFKSLILPKHILAAPLGLKEQMSSWGFIEFIMKFAGTICYPILTISLLATLRAIKKKRKNLQKKETDQSDNTTKLILFMTILFMFSEGFEGLEALLLYNLERIVEYNEELSFAVVSFQYPINILRVLNALSHPFVCFLLSSQYRDALKGIFVNKRKVSRNATATRSTFSNSQVKRADFIRSTSNIRSKTTSTTSY
ncbi:hypothetical protein CAEBREN_05918 [Caenorhabditis brenneri]|uniref:G-protein coupled receptors family 1 profile domain-containing protein n=1 Tax=Caenorhabditis brenneri TaxID=135651 RepID=G0NIA5_CAEBE|nr:hypothetical protein CAEBREN_05918 [Caenorhabditis brenneri]